MMKHECADHMTKKDQAIVKIIKIMIINCTIFSLFVLLIFNRLFVNVGQRFWREFGTIQKLLCAVYFSAHSLLTCRR